MAKIFVVMGKSSSGKDTIFKRLSADYGTVLKTLVGYTTRPKRDGETDGAEYFFVDEKQLARFRQDGQVIECRTYQTVFGPWHYFTADDGQIQADGGQGYLYIGTLESYAALREYYGAQMVVPIYIEVEPGLRLERALKRERAQEHPKYTEMCRRFLADEEDFKEDNLRRLAIERRFSNNEEPEACLTSVKAYINSFFPI